MSSYDGGTPFNADYTRLTLLNLEDSRPLSLLLGCVTPQDHCFPRTSILVYSVENLVDSSVHGRSTLQSNVMP